MIILFQYLIPFIELHSAKIAFINCIISLRCCSIVQILWHRIRPIVGIASIIFGIVHSPFCLRCSAIFRFLSFFLRYFAYRQLLFQETMFLLHKPIILFLAVDFFVPAYPTSHYFKLIFLSFFIYQQYDCLFLWTIYLISSLNIIFPIPNVDYLPLADFNELTIFFYIHMNE